MIALMLAWIGLQSQRTITGRIVDASTGEPVVSALVSLMGSKRGCSTDSSGQFSLTVSTTHVQLKITRLGFRPVLHAVSDSWADAFTIAMTPNPEWDAVVITAGAEPVLEDRSIHLYDYEFADDGLYMILYDKVRKRSVLAWVDSHDSIVSLLDAPEPPGRLLKDCMGQVHAITKRYACQLFRDEHGSVGMYVDSLKLFQEVVAPCLGHADGNYFFRQDRINGQLAHFYRYDGNSLQPKVVLALKDKEKVYQMLDPYGAYAPFASTEKQLMAISDQTWDKINKLDPELRFQRLAFFYPIHAPLRVIDGDVWIFDHCNEMIRRFDASGNRLDSVEIDYPSMPKWDRQIIVDEWRGDVYTTTERHGFITLHAIDLKTGELGMTWELPLQFPRKIQVKDGVAYFMYKEQESYDDTKRLYRLSLVP